MKLTNEEKAKAAVDVMVKDGLDCSAMMHRKIEANIIRLLGLHEKEVREECANSKANVPNVNKRVHFRTKTNE